MALPLILAGGMILAPRSFFRLERGLERCLPDFHQSRMLEVERFVNDTSRCIRQAEPNGCS
jgi:hypothetical protein